MTPLYHQRQAHIKYISHRKVPNLYPEKNISFILGNVLVLEIIPLAAISVYQNRSHTASLVSRSELFVFTNKVGMVSMCEWVASIRTPGYRLLWLQDRMVDANSHRYVILWYYWVGKPMYTWQILLWLITWYSTRNYAFCRYNNLVSKHKEPNTILT